jgi:ethanolamine ammonia-lyase small subunit
VLGLAIGRDDVGYGEVYVASSSEDRIRFLSRSEIGREFQGELVVRRVRDHSVAEYFLLALPDDQLLHQRVRRLERQIAEGVRALDPSAQLEGLEERQKNRAVQGRTPSFPGMR